MMAIVLLLWCGVGGVIGYAIGNSKGQGVLGFWLGLFLGVIGWILVAFSPPSDEVLAERAAATTVLHAQVEQVEAQRILRPCAFCAEMIQPSAIVCRYCGRDVEPINEPPPLIAAASREERMADLASRFPYFLAEAQSALAERPHQPTNDIEWLERVCLELRAGKQLRRAVEKVDGPVAGAGWY